MICLIRALYLYNSFTEQEINEAHLLMLKEGDLNSFGFKMDSKVKLRSLIENLISEGVPKQNSIIGAHEKQSDIVNVSMSKPRKK